MKKVFVFILTMFLIGLSYAKVDYSYEKKSDDVMKITEVETTVRTNEINITIKCLKDRIKSLDDQKANALESYTNNILGLNEKIAFIENQIKEAKKLGVVEPAVNFMQSR